MAEQQQSDEVQRQLQNLLEEVARERLRAQEATLLAEQQRQLAEESSRREQEARQREQEARQREQEARQREQEARQRQQEARQRQQEANRRAERQRQLAEQRVKLANGTFFAFFDSIWDVEPVVPENDHFTAMFRTSIPSAVEGYDITMNRAQSTVSVAAKESQSSGSGSGNRETVWSFDVLSFPVQGDLAHLVPASATKASLYHDIAKWVFGLPGEVSSEIIQKLIHGSRPNAGSRRTSHSGLKHFACNKILLQSQRFFDGDGAGVLIVPIMSLQEAQNWNGEGYQAIFMIAPRTDARVWRNPSAGEIAGTVGLHRVEPRPDHYASVDELEASRILLKAFLLGIGWSLWYSLPRIATFTPEERNALSSLQEGASLVDGTRRVLVPQCLREVYPHPRVLKIDLGSGEEECHPPPDPMLLTVKAANVWSTFHRQKLVPGGSVKELDDEDELSDEMRLAWCESIANDERRRGLIGMSIAF